MDLSLELDTVVNTLESGKWRDPESNEKIFLFLLRTTSPGDPCKMWTPSAKERRKYGRKWASELSRTDYGQYKVRDTIHTSVASLVL